MGEQEFHDLLFALGILGPIAVVLGGIWMSKLGVLIALYLKQRHERECREELHKEAQKKFTY